ncbi:MAG: hypothetical protein JWO06_2217 [Bacteroidota bacterium]|nr:hypothetical protein [Bacteroidota bacterium]
MKDISVIWTPVWYALDQSIKCSGTGNFKLCLNSTETTALHILKYIDYSKRQSDFDLKTNLNSSDDIEISLQKAESEFEDLIDTNHWKIISSTGETTNILVPVFYNSGICWRLNFEHEKG